MTYEYDVELVTEDEGPEPELRERFTVIIARRFGQLEEKEGVYPKAGDAFDFMDSFSGPYVWEMTAAEFEANPPSQVDFEVLDVEPAEPAGSGTVKVRVRIPV